MLAVSGNSMNPICRQRFLLNALEQKYGVRPHNTSHSQWPFTEGWGVPYQYLAFALPIPG